jgi:hypothetical protein
MAQMEIAHPALAQQILVAVVVVVANLELEIQHLLAVLA